MAPPALQLSSTENNDSSISLQWEKLPTDIERLEVIRYVETNSSEELIASITNQASTSYIDKEVPFSGEINYYIRYYNSAGHSRISNTVTNQGSPILNIQPLQAEIHESKPLIYIKASESKIIVF